MTTMTAARLERLARRWGISKSETMRSALEKAKNDATMETEELPDFTGMSPVKILDWLRDHPSPSVPGGWGNDFRRELREMRKRDAGIEEERERERSPTGHVKAAEPRE